MAVPIVFITEFHMNVQLLYFALWKSVLSQNGSNEQFVTPSVMLTFLNVTEHIKDWLAGGANHKLSSMKSFLG